MAKLLIIRGVPGSGKSTIAQDYVAQGYAHFEADMYHINVHNKYDWKPENVKKSHAWCFDQTAKALAAGDNVVVSNTFARKWEYESYIKLAKANGAEVEIITATGNYSNIHNVPDHTIARMRRRWEK